MPGPGGQAAAQGPALGAVPGLVLPAVLQAELGPQAAQEQAPALALHPGLLLCSVAALVGWTGLAVRAIRVLETQRSLIGGLPPYTWPVPPSADRPCATGLRALNFLVHANITNQAAVVNQCGQRLEDKARGSLHGNEHRVWEGKGR